MAAYDEMSEAERRRLAEVLGGLHRIARWATGSLAGRDSFDTIPP